MTVPRETFSEDHAENSGTSQKPDYSTWLTKQQAATALGCSTKTVEQLADRGKLQQASWRRPDGGPRLAVYHPDDVARIARERHPEPAPFVLPAGGDLKASGNGRGGAIRESRIANDESLALALPAADDTWRALLAAALRAVTSESSQKPDPSSLFLDLPEAAAFTGLTAAYLRRLIKATQLEAVKDRGWKIRKRDLEAL